MPPTATGAASAPPSRSIRRRDRLPRETGKRFPPISPPLGRSRSGSPASPIRSRLKGVRKPPSSPTISAKARSSPCALPWTGDHPQAGGRLGMGWIAYRPLPGADRSPDGPGLRALRDDLQAASLHVLLVRPCGALLSARLAAAAGLLSNACGTSGRCRLRDQRPKQRRRDRRAPVDRSPGVRGADRHVGQDHRRDHSDQLNPAPSPTAHTSDDSTGVTVGSRSLWHRSRGWALRNPTAWSMAIARLLLVHRRSVSRARQVLANRAKQQRGGA